ncbi:Golgi transport complex subunit 5-domain-containing protein [Limtongia smithiae]|uniref:Golgi transport complex subunit 5-domain-containing protein n=1 Tax=Limtongia smithiae TaxID=1125753 RepID=UPI0034CF754E
MTSTTSAILPAPSSTLPTNTLDDENDEEDEYIDYRLFTAPDFDAVGFCNSLVLATTTATDTRVDLGAAQQRVQFDLEAVEKSIHKEAVENHSALIAHASTLSVASTVLSTTSAALETATASYTRLESEVLRPYNTALPVYTALTKVHAAANLLRGLAWLVYIVRQVCAFQQQALSAAAAAPAQLSDATRAEIARANARAARAFAEMTKHLQTFPRLRTLRVVSELEHAVRNSRETGMPLR